MHERSINTCHEAVRYWVTRFGSKIARSIKRKRMDKHSNWQWHLDEVFVKINGELHYFWQAVDLYVEVLECYISKRSNKHAAKKFILKSLKKHDIPKKFVTNRLASYHAVLRNIGIAYRHIKERRLNNSCENSHLPFPRRERAMQKFKSVTGLEDFINIQGQIYNHFNHERHLISRQPFKEKRITALEQSAI